MRRLILVVKIMLKKYLTKIKWRRINLDNETAVVNGFDLNVVKVGKMSYGPLEVYGWKAENEKLIIGNYVSIASGVKFILGGNHYYDTFSTYPFKVKLGIQENEAYSNGSIIVEDDVWIGMDSIIMSGITIGKGSVIAAGSVVVKNVLPYSIVGGNPAKTIKMRFEDSLINKLLEIDMCKLDHGMIKNNIELFYTKLDESRLDEIMEMLDS